MKVTQVIFRAIHNEEKKNLLGFADVTFDESLVIRGIRVTMGKYGPFVSFPNRKGEDGKFYDTVFSITKDLRNDITESILKEGNLLDMPSRNKSDNKEDDFWDN